MSMIMPHVPTRGRVSMMTGGGVSVMTRGGVYVTAMLTVQAVLVVAVGGVVIHVLYRLHGEHVSGLHNKSYKCVHKYVYKSG